MKTFAWNDEKNRLLKADRQVCFEDVVISIEMGFLLDVLEHPNQEKYKGQKIFVVRIDDYIYLVPFVESDDEVFLKTIIPSRKATRKYLKGGAG
ncbi:MAG: toxin [Anaerolinea sp.]|nr:toxin [Anaerolinea sp.]